MPSTPIEALLDVNVVIASVFADHVMHGPVSVLTIDTFLRPRSLATWVQRPNCPSAAIPFPDLVVSAGNPRTRAALSGPPLPRPVRSSFNVGGFRQLIAPLWQTTASQRRQNRSFHSRAKALETPGEGTGPTMRRSSTL